MYQCTDEQPDLRSKCTNVPMNIQINVPMPILLATGTAEVLLISKCGGLRPISKLANGTADDYFE